MNTTSCISPNSGHIIDFAQRLTQQRVLWDICQHGRAGFNTYLRNEKWKYLRAYATPSIEGQFNVLLFVNNSLPPDDSDPTCPTPVLPIRIFVDGADRRWPHLVARYPDFLSHGGRWLRPTTPAATSAPRAPHCATHVSNDCSTGHLSIERQVASPSRTSSKRASARIQPSWLRGRAITIMARHRAVWRALLPEVTMRTTGAFWPARADVLVCVSARFCFLSGPLCFSGRSRSSGWSRLPWQSRWLVLVRQHHVP